MANVKLFRVTEFAESVFQSPLAHRTALHPVWAMLAVALWVATVGHWPLWQTLLQTLMPSGDAQAASSSARWTLPATMAAQITLSALLLLALTGWRWVLKTALYLLLLWTALGTCAMWLQRTAGEAVALTPGGLMQFLLNADNWALLKTWPCGLILLGVFFLPAVLVWRSRLRRIPFAQSLLVNALLFMACYALLVWTTGLYSHVLPSPLDVMAIWHSLRA